MSDGVWVIVYGSTEAHWTSLDRYNRPLNVAFCGTMTHGPSHNFRRGSGLRPEGPESACPRCLAMEPNHD